MNGQPASPAGPPKRDSTPFDQLRQLFISVWKEGKTAFAALGAIIYAVTRVNLDAFYRRLGLTPDDVGLTEAAILGRAALYFVLFVAGSLIVFAVAWIMSWILLTLVWIVCLIFLRVPPAARPQEVTALRLLLALVLLIGIDRWAVGLQTLRLLDDDTFGYLTSSYRVFYFLTAKIVLLIGQAVALVTLAYMFLAFLLTRQNKWTTVVVAGLLVSTLAIASFPLAWGRGNTIADYVVVHNRPLGRPAFAILSLHADPVCVFWTGDYAYMSGYYFYLGSADGKLVLYDPDYTKSRGRAVKLPSDGAQLVNFRYDERLDTKAYQEDCVKHAPPSPKPPSPKKGFEPAG